MSRAEFFRRTLLSAGIFAALPCVLAAQERAAQEAISAGPAPDVAVLHVESESLLRVDFPGRKSWGHVEKGAVSEGRLLLPLYAGEQIAVPADSTIRVTVNSVEKIRDDCGFWRKTGRAIVRTFNPLETSRPTEYRVELRAADLVLPTGEVLPLDARVLRASSGVMVQPKAKSSQGVGAARKKSQTSATLLMALRREELFSVPAEPNVASAVAAGEQYVARAYLLTALRASLNRPGDTFRAQLAEPVRVGGRVFGPPTVLEGAVIRSVAPRILSRAGSLYLRVDRIVPPGGEPLRVGGSLSAAEADAQARFALDEEGALHGRKPGMVNGLVDLGYAYALGKVSDDIAETPIRAIGASMSNAAVANAARYVGLGTSLAFLLTRHGRDVYLPQYSLIEIDFGRVSETAAPAKARLIRRSVPCSPADL
jgi:hypothetical protein